MRVAFQDLSSWDPLEAANETDKDVLASAKKREIKNILKSYVSNYDPFSELIQNAMDAVDKRFEVDPSITSRIKIAIDLAENSVEVIDNGCGFEEQEFKSFLAPSISFKSGGNTRGNKGVGVTYIAYGFNDLTIRTKNKHFAFEGALRRGREWIEDSSGTVSRPVVEATKSKSAAFDELDQGTSFKIVFSGKSVRPSSLGWYQAKTPEQWLYLLLLKTPLGGIDLPSFSSSGVVFDLTVIDKNDEIASVEDVLANYKFPHQEIGASQQLSKIVDAQRRAVSAGKNPAKAISKYRKSNGIYEVYDVASLEKVTNLSKAEKILLNYHGATAYGYFAYSTEVWDQVNDKKAKLRKGLRILRGGLQLASNKMTQGDLITIPLSKNIGHQNQTHIIVHFKGAEPDLGRKGFQPELKELAEKLSIGIVRQLSQRRGEILKSDSGAQADIEKELKVHEWIKNQEKHEEDNPLILESERFFLPTKKISISSVPQTEQDTIVLFNQLIAGGVIRGLKLMTTSQTTQYDGIFRYVAEDPLKDLIFDKENNPLGVLEEQLVKPYRSRPKVLEYKFSLDGLIPTRSKSDSSGRDSQDQRIMILKSDNHWRS
ncbi:MAG: ATP-binding protein, partial [Alphaproteobacteria bacterium]|nr:ATP-binding protein [Alphaproteobacteria bacterium]